MGRRRVSQGLNARALPRFFIAPEALLTGELPHEIAHQVRRVLRLREGDIICLLDGIGKAYFARLHGNEAQFELIGQEQLATEPPLKMSVLQALVRNEKAEQVVRLCTAAGANQILFAPAERSLVEWGEAKRRARQQRWQVIAREEAELACRARYPLVQILPDWWSAIEQLPPPRLLLDEWADVRPLREGLLKEQALSIIVGPEGGFTPRERQMMTQQYECLPVSLGARVLRVEIAAFYALAQLEALLPCWTESKNDASNEPAH